MPTPLMVALVHFGAILSLILLYLLGMVEASCEKGSTHACSVHINYATCRAETTDGMVSRMRSDTTASAAVKTPQHNERVLQRSQDGRWFGMQNGFLSTLKTGYQYDVLSSFLQQASSFLTTSSVVHPLALAVVKLKCKSYLPLCVNTPADAFGTCRSKPIHLMKR